MNDTETQKDDWYFSEREREREKKKSKENYYINL